MATPASNEERELNLVDKVDFRIALADTDAKLEAILRTYLTPLLLKLASEHASVRQKVTGICQSINVRIQPQNIRLPVQALVKQFKQNAASPYIRHFDLLYIQRGIGRLDQEERAALLPEIIASIAEDINSTGSQGPIVFNLFLKTLIAYKFPPRSSKEDEQLRMNFNFSDADGETLSRCFQHLLLLPLSASVQQQQQAGPGLSASDTAFLTLQGKEGVWNPSAEGGLGLIETKQAVLRLLASGLLKDSEKLLPALIASADPNAKIYEAGEEILKKSAANVSLESEVLVSRLFDIYFGKTSSSSQNDVRPSVTSPVRMKILSLLSKSNKSTSFTSEIVEIAKLNLLNSQGLDDRGPGRETSKLSSATIAYLTFVARTASKQDMLKIGEAVIESLKDFLDQYSNAYSWDLASIRGRSFEVIGLLASSNSQLLLEPDLTLLKWLFRCLSDEPNKEVIFSIDGAISAILRPFQQPKEGPVEHALRDLLLQNMKVEDGNRKNVRYATLRFANRCLAYNDVSARWIDIIALAEASDNNHEILEEARRGLDPYWYRLLHSGASSEDAGQRFQSHSGERSEFPKFSSLVRYMILEHQDEALTPVLLLEIVHLCRQALYLESLSSSRIPVEFNTDWERKLDAAVSEELEAREAVRAYLSKISGEPLEAELFLRLWASNLHGLIRSTSKSQVTFAHFAYELCSLCPDSLMTQMTSQLTSFEQAAGLNDIEVRVNSAKTYGLLASEPNIPLEALARSTENLLNQATQWKAVVGSGINRAHGAIIALAFLITRRAYRGKINTVTQESNALLRLIFDILDHSTDSLLLEASYQALSQCTLFNVFSIPDIEKHVSFQSLVEKLAKKGLSGDVKAIAALGALSIVLDEENSETQLDFLSDQIRSLHEIRQAETQFAVGEALSIVASAWQCKTLISTFDMSGKPPSGSNRSKIMTRILEKVLDDSTSNKPARKKASVIWLLCLLQFCSTHEEIKKRLAQFQLAFKRCLSDRDELVQESASRGLGLVYEKGDRDLKDDLVRDLVSSFSSNKSNMAGTVSEDTELFEPGALPTGDGSITTYKDIMSLASEVGDSSLVYRFMSLASNNAIWSSRAAFGRFGLSSVLSDSSVDGYLADNPKLYPKLYRYRFDANQNVRRSMNDIWNALVKDSAATVEAHFDAIIEDLLVNIVGREWRTRQASCAAISDLIQGRKLERIQPYVDRCWTLCFKVLDDIKGSVRASAADLARVLTGILLRNLESGESKTETISAMLKSVLPFILSTSGLESMAKEVKEVSLHTLLQIIKKSKENILRPFIPELVERLLGMLSTFEPEAVNYVHMNASKYNMKEEEIDDLRLKSVRSSPLMEAIERCLDQADEDTMREVVPRLQNAIKTAVGLPTKVGCSRILVSLSTRRAFIFRQFSDQFLQSVEKHAVDRNPTVSTSYATAMGYLARGSTDGQILRITAVVKDRYFAAEEDSTRLVTGEIFHSIAKHATDRFNSLAASLLPFIFFASHDNEESVKQVYREAWDETVGGARAASLYLEEITLLVSTHLDSRRWGVKHAAALTVAEGITLISSSQGHISEEQANKLWPLLKTSIQGRHWEGKDKIISAYDLFVEKSSMNGDMKADVKNLAEKVERARAKAKEEAESGN